MIILQIFMKLSCLEVAFAKFVFLQIFVFIEDSDRTQDERGLENYIMGVKYLGCDPSSFYHTRRFISQGAVRCSEDRIS